MTVKEHYERHLGNFYSWMAGDFETKRKEFQDFLSSHGITPRSTKRALDLGAGHGIQSVAMAHLGFDVTAVDFNEQLLKELDLHTMGMRVNIIRDDIRSVSRFGNLRPELIVCWGDTLTHLDDKEDVKRFIKDVCSVLEPDAKFLLSFRDYSTELTGAKRFIPVKSDDTRILTCFLEYDHDFVSVTDLLYEKIDHGWQQKVSSYRKVRVASSQVIELLGRNGMSIIENQIIQGMIALIAQKS
jgi:2-polyprenyl-3-methyl-5-hydroxy-6-metoxy-1,4-benzoquinol methylase